MRGAYGLERDAIEKLYEGLLSALNLHFEAESILLATLHLYKRGFDFADALHLSSSLDCDTFFTFDKKFLAKSAGRVPSCRFPEH